MVYDQNRFVKDKVPPPLDKCKKSHAYHNLTHCMSLSLSLSLSLFLDIQFNESGLGYLPIVYINDYWNLASEYMPMNNTVKYALLSLVYMLCVHGSVSVCVHIV